MEPATLGSVNKVVFHLDTCGSFVGVEPPSAVAVAFDVVNDISRYLGAGADSQAVNRAHVAEHALSDVVNMVIEDFVIFGITFAIPPSPPNRDPGVVKVGDGVVGDPVVAALAYPDSDGAGQESAAFLDRRVIHGDVRGGSFAA